MSCDNSVDKYLTRSSSSSSSSSPPPPLLLLPPRRCRTCWAAGDKAGQDLLAEFDTSGDGIIDPAELANAAGPDCATHT